MHHLLGCGVLIAVLACAAPGLAQAGPNPGHSQEVGAVTPAPRAEPAPVVLAPAWKVRRYERLRVAGIALLVTYGVATFATALALSSADQGCHEDDDFCLTFPFGVYFGAAALLGSPLLISGLTTYGIGKRRLRQLPKVTPALTFERGTARLVVQARW